MIVSLSGSVSEKILNQVVLEVHGVGYGVLVTHEDYHKLTIGKQAKLYIYEYIRENADDYYGFLSLETKGLFELLLTVNGVGPRMALNMLSIGGVNEVQRAIASGDVKLLQSAHSVGKRVAERVIVDLKDKVGLADTTDPRALFASSAAAAKDEAVQALVALGYSVPDALDCLSNINSELSTQERVKQALKEIKV